jgi:hypothetical protein
MPVKRKRTAEDYYPYLSDGDQPLEVKTQGCYVGTLSSSGNRFVVAMPNDAKITAVKLVVDTTISADSTNYWSVQVNNLTRSRDLLATASTFNKLVDITGDTVVELTPDQNDEVTADDVIEVQCTKNASADNLSNLYIQVEYIASGEATTTSSSTSTSTSSSTTTTTTTTTTSSSTTSTSSSTTTT